MHKNRVVLKNVNIYQQGLADILIDEGRIIHISKEPGYEVGDAVCHDLKSHLMVPPMWNPTSIWTIHTLHSTQAQSTGQARCLKELPDGRR